MDIMLRADNDLKMGKRAMLIGAFGAILLLLVASYVTMIFGWGWGTPFIVVLILMIWVVRYWILINHVNKKYITKLNKIKQTGKCIDGRVVSVKYIRHDQENNLYRLFFDPEPRYLIGDEIKSKDIQEDYHIDTIFTVKGSDGKLYESPRYCDKLGNIGDCTIYINPNNDDNYYVAFESKEGNKDEVV